MWFNNCSKKFSRHTSPPIGRANYIKSKQPILQFKTTAASANHESLTLTPTIKLLLKLTFKSVIDSKKKQNNPLSPHIDPTLFSKIRVSSKNWRWEIDLMFNCITSTYFPIILLPCFHFLMNRGNKLRT